MKGAAIPYSVEELAWLELNHKMPISDFTAAFNQHFNRNVAAHNLHALRKRKGWKTGRTGQFPKGNVPANFGKKMPYNANSARTQFKKGQIPKNAKYVGHERVTPDGYVEINVDERNPYTGFKCRYALKHRYLWEKANGPLPDDFILKCKDGNKQNTDPSNWEPMPRGTLPFMNGHRGFNHDAAHPDVRPAIRSLAKLRHATKNARTKMSAK
ncbi:HNH endonuclease [Brucella sp. 21LCYQ03]|nr:HNH endonuclease [Brucella sp. 21LCYQ03]